jgi:hypothetical protein
MPDLNVQNSRRALAAASGFLRRAGIMRVWIEQGGGHGATFVVETETLGPSASDPPAKATAALRQALAGLHAPRWRARDGSDIVEALVVCRVSAPGARASHSADSIVWPPAEIAAAIERDVARGGEDAKRLSEALTELIRLEQSGGPDAAGRWPERHD